jgi:hypothetical protein
MLPIIYIHAWRIWLSLQFPHHELSNENLISMCKILVHTLRNYVLTGTTKDRAKDLLDIMEKLALVLLRVSLPLLCVSLFSFVVVETGSLRVVEFLSLWVSLLEFRTSWCKVSGINSSSIPICKKPNFMLKREQFELFKNYYDWSTLDPHYYAQV